MMPSKAARKRRGAAKTLLSRPSPASVAAAAGPKQASSPWIISPFWDSVLFIGAPLTTILTLYPAKVLWAHSQSYSFLLLCFFTFGHHLPGFMRAYGDRELFARYRWRFLLAPLIFFAAALWFQLKDLHGLLIFVFAWDIWHVLMQHYGFMRIYDAKRGEISPLTARMDWVMSITFYVATIIASPHYRHNLLLQSYLSGVPVIPPAVFGFLETAVYAVAGMVTLAYLSYNLHLWKQGRLNPLKLATLATFLGASYLLYVYVEDFIVGFAVWSAFHCIQYYGIVWVYNRNRVAKGGPVTAFVRFLFRPRTALAVLYVGLILAYGGINYLQRFVADEMFLAVLLAFIATSNALHYYYDGFIWKVREKETRRDLDIIAEASSATKAAAVESARSALRWVRRLLPDYNRGLVQAAYLGAILALLAGLEMWRPNDSLTIRQSLAAVAPEAEESLVQLGEELRRDGRDAEALEAYREAVRIKPSYAEAHAVAAITLAGLGRAEEAIESYRRALEANPRFSTVHFNLAQLLEAEGRIGEALEHYREAVHGDDPDARRLAAAALEKLQARK